MWTEGSALDLVHSDVTDAANSIVIRPGSALDDVAINDCHENNQSTLVVMGGANPIQGLPFVETILLVITSSLRRRFRAA